MDTTVMLKAHQLDVLTAAFGGVANWRFNLLGGTPMAGSHGNRL
jgi:hypothetical protein